MYIVIYIYIYIYLYIYIYIYIIFLILPDNLYIYIYSSTDRLFLCITTLQFALTRRTLAAGVAKSIKTAVFKKDSRIEIKHELKLYTF